MTKQTADDMGKDWPSSEDATIDRPLGSPNWAPLEKWLGPADRRLNDWMWMYHKDGLEYYKHIDTRKYLSIDAQGRAFVGGWLELDFWAAYRNASNDGGYAQ
jgi:hypothetical protein